MTDFYLNGLLHCCDVPMWPITRRTYDDRVLRRYRCERCGQGVDALAAEVEVWELATRAAPALGHPHTPYDLRGAQLVGALARVSRSGDRFALVWITMGPSSRKS
ncbi:hypothetical protein [Luedemannella flava]|uniref:hypothetical protein n=1 Tax=Luedemannella flava TaxID=349316 RepID=UPI0031E1EBD5